jgi:hypothetical protein
MSMLGESGNTTPMDEIETDFDQSVKFATQLEEGTEQVVEIRTTTSERIVSVQSAPTAQLETLEEE